MKVTACECVEPGWCPRHWCWKSELDFQLCRRRPDYFQAWEEDRGPGQGETSSVWASVGSAWVSNPAEPASRRSPQAPSAASLAARLLCRHRGAVMETRECAACKGRVRLKLFRCDLHGSCTTLRALEGTACCARCEKYEPPLSASQGGMR
jgi:hypothetical protein